MILPFITAITRDVFSTVPVLLRECAYGMGMTTWEVVRHIIIPYTRLGLVGGVMLGLGRALGETMAVTFVIGNSHRISASLLAPATTISASIANEFTEATTDALHLEPDRAWPHPVRHHLPGARPRQVAGRPDRNLLRQRPCRIDLAPQVPQSRRHGAVDGGHGLRPVLPRRDPVDAALERASAPSTRASSSNDPAAGRERRSRQRHLRLAGHDPRRHPGRHPDRHPRRHLPVGIFRRLEDRRGGEVHQRRAAERAFDHRRPVHLRDAGRARSAISRPGPGRRRWA